jgi:hypothetical protein
MACAQYIDIHACPVRSVGTRQVPYLVRVRHVVRVIPHYSCTITVPVLYNNQ